MRISSVFLTALGAIVISIPLMAQTTPAPAAPFKAPAVDGWTNRSIVLAPPKDSAPAPRRDLTGIWNPMNGASDGIQAFGAKNMPDDGKPEHALPYTPEGVAAFTSHHPGFGTRFVEPLRIDDPVNFCDPQGMPRQDLYEMRTTQILQNAKSVIILYEYNKIWRTLWMDGRQLPKDPEPQWYGYSTGTWVDDYTFVAQTIGVDGRTWLDNAGRPHSDAAQIEERFHRVSKDQLELTVTITDPKHYTKPWVAMDKFPMVLAPDDFHAREMVCSPSEYKKYLSTFAPDAQ
jgi:hypothetical protein